MLQVRQIASGGIWGEESKEGMHLRPGLQADGRGQAVEQVGRSQAGQDAGRSTSLGSFMGSSSLGRLGSIKSLLLLLGQGQTLQLMIKLLEDINVANKGLARLFNNGLVSRLIDLDLVQMDTEHLLELVLVLDTVKVVECDSLALGEVVVLLQLLGEDLTTGEVSEVADVSVGDEEFGLGLGAAADGVGVGLLGGGEGQEHVAPLGAVEELEVLLEGGLAVELGGEVDQLDVLVVLVLLQGFLKSAIGWMRMCRRERNYMVSWMKAGYKRKGREEGG